MEQPPKYPAHNVFDIDNVTFSSNFDNGNLLLVEKKKHMEYMIWSACDNHGTPYETKNCTWFYFTVRGLPKGSTVKIHVMNQQRNGSLYKFDHRPVYKAESTGMKWCRIRNAVKFNKNDECPLSFEHHVTDESTIHFAFTYPYTYTMVQNDLDSLSNHANTMEVPDSIFYQRELLTFSPDKRRVDLLTITSVDGASQETEDVLPGLFPEITSSASTQRPPTFPEKEIIFISARVHSGEVPAQHAFKGILDFLMNSDDLRAIEMRRRYVFKLIPMLNPDGVFRGNFRCDQFGNNLNRHYLNPDISQHPSIYAVKNLQEYYAINRNIAMYLDLHAHASKRGCFIYGNVMDSFEHQVQNQLYCKLIAMNTAHFDYEGCLFSRDHMTRVDPGDRNSGLTAEGSGRVSTFLSHKIIHSYTLECNYNCSKYQNEVVAMSSDCRSTNVNKPSSYATTSERYTPAIYEGVGRACMVAMLDLRGHNPCSRIPMTRVKTVGRIRQAVMGEVRQRSEHRGHRMNHRKRNQSSSSSGGKEDIPWVSRTDESYVPKTKSELVSLPKVPEPAPKSTRSAKEKHIAKPESLKLKHASISLPTQIDNSSSNAADSAVQHVISSPQSPVRNPNGTHHLKYKRYFASREGRRSQSGGSEPRQCSSRDSADGDDPHISGSSCLSLNKSRCRSRRSSNAETLAKVDKDKQIYRTDTDVTVDEESGADDGLEKEVSASALGPQEPISRDVSGEINAPEISLEAPHPPTMSQFCLQMDKVTISPRGESCPGVELQNQKDAQVLSKAEYMLNTTDSKEYLPSNVMRAYKPFNERKSRLPRPSRGKNSLFTCNE